MDIDSSKISLDNNNNMNIIVPDDWMNINI